MAENYITFVEIPTKYAAFVAVQILRGIFDWGDNELSEPFVYDEQYETYNGTKWTDDQIVGPLGKAGCSFSLVVRSGYDGWDGTIDYTPELGSHEMSEGEYGDDLVEANVLSRILVMTDITEIHALCREELSTKWDEVFERLRQTRAPLTNLLEFASGPFVYDPDGHRAWGPFDSMTDAVAFTCGPMVVTDLETMQDRYRDVPVLNPKGDA